MKKLVTTLAMGGALGASLLCAQEAQACGGCFVPPTATTVVTAHRMALSISPDQSVLWDQIQYAGAPEDFSWVLPVKAGARIETASDAWFEALDAATSVTVQAPPEGCAFNSSSGGFGCGSDDSAALSAAEGGFGARGVTVLHKGTVGPYETVTLRAEDPNALQAWLDDNGYAVPEGIQPTIDAYVEEEFDFIALRLQPGAGVQQMQPVRVISPGMDASLPLRMVAAGVGANVALTLFVIGEGRYQPANFESTTLPPELVTWDFATSESDYGSMRLAAMAANEGRTWLTTYAQTGTLLSPRYDPIGFTDLTYAVGSEQWFTIAQAYVAQGVDNGESQDKSCLGGLDGAGGSGDKVVRLCDEDGECRPLESGEIDMRELACEGLDDAAVALVGLHPRDVTLTRLEANLPAAALDDDLLLEAADDQQPVENRFQAQLSLNACTDEGEERASLLSLSPNGRDPLGPGGLSLLTLAAAGAWLSARRRRGFAASE